MSERQEKKRRHNARLEYIAAFVMWLDREPPRMFFWRWHKWKRERPVWRGPVNEWSAGNG